MAGKIILYGAIALIFFITAVVILKGVKKKPKFFLIAAGIGAAVMLLVKLLALILGFPFPLSVSGFAVSSVLGPAGVALMLFLNLLF